MVTKLRSVFLLVCYDLLVCVCVCMCLWKLKVIKFLKARKFYQAEIWNYYYYNSFLEVTLSPILLTNMYDTFPLTPTIWLFESISYYSSVIILECNGTWRYTPRLIILCKVQEWVLRGWSSHDRNNFILLYFYSQRIIKKLVWLNGTNRKRNIKWLNAVLWNKST